MVKRLLSLGAAALAALVGGCGDGPSTVPGGYRSAATWSSFIYATTGGPLLLRVIGDPFGTGSEPLLTSVALAMSQAIPARPFVMTAEAAQAARPNFRVTLVFAPPAALDERAVCAGTLPDAAPVAKGGKIEATAVFCDGEALLASVRGWVAKVDGVEDRRFRLLLGQMARELLEQPQ